MSIRAEIILSVYGQAGEAGGAQYRLGLLNMVGRPLSSAVATVARVLDALARNDPPRRSACFCGWWSTRHGRPRGNLRLLGLRFLLSPEHYEWSDYCCELSQLLSGLRAHHAPIAELGVRVRANVMSANPLLTGIVQVLLRWDMVR